MLRAFTVFLALIAPLPVAPAFADTRVPTSQAEIALGFAPLVKQAAPAVVNIYAKRVVQVSDSPFMGDPFFRDFFQERTRPKVQNSLGSGVILTAGGIVVTNYHVVGQATDIRVVLNDRREFSARLVMSDQESDLAVLQMQDADGLPHLGMRDSDTVLVGELVLAIGNPFGVGQTVTSGIVSGLARSGTATGSSRGYFIQTDAPINPGNSGGALVDINGDLIGINTRILTRSGSSNGIGFAIPAALVAEFVDQAEAGFDRFVRPWAGMSGQPVDNDLAESLGLAIPQGILISQVHAVSPFNEAGFRAGDVIRAIDGYAVNTPEEMVFRMSVSGLGNRVNVQRFRDGEIDELPVRLMPAPEDPARAAQTVPDAVALAGVTLVNVNPAVMAEFGLPLTVRGVVVSDPGPIGARAGLRKGDVIMAIDGAKVATTSAALAALKDARRSLSLEVQRGAQRVQMRFRF
ncbi:MAG: serine protease [Rhodobacterales bacterium]|nr:MAG: serine protease [Rhodobacterales bacterium]